MVLSSQVRSRMRQALFSHTSEDELCDAIDSLSAGAANSLVTVVDETLTLTNAVKLDMTAVVPAGAVIRSVHVNLQTAVTGDATGDDLFVKIGLGITGTPAKYGSTSAITANAKITRIPTHAVLASAETLGLYAVKTDGTSAATEKFTAGGIVKVRVVYETPVALANA